MAVHKPELFSTAQVFRPATFNQVEFQSFNRKKDGCSSTPQTSSSSVLASRLERMEDEEELLRLAQRNPNRYCTDADGLISTTT